MYSTKKMGRNPSELTKLACLKICDGIGHIMSHFCPTALAGIVHPQLVLITVGIFGPFFNHSSIIFHFILFPFFSKLKLRMKEIWIQNGTLTLLLQKWMQKMIMSLKGKMHFCSIFLIFPFQGGADCHVNQNFSRCYNKWYRWNPPHWWLILLYNICFWQVFVRMAHTCAYHKKCHLCNKHDHIMFIAWSGHC